MIEKTMFTKAQEYSQLTLRELCVVPTPKPGVNYSYLVGEEPKYVMKIPQFITNEEVLTEAKVLEIYRKNRIPVPEIISLEKSPLFDDKIVMIQTYIDHDRESDLRDAEKLGVLARNMHNISLGGYGWVNDKTMKGYWDNYHKMLKDDITKRREDVETALGCTIEHILGDMSFLPVKNSLLHYDFRPHHVLIKDDKIAGVIDPTGYVGDLFADIGALFLKSCNGEYVKNFLSGHSPDGLTDEEQKRLDFFAKYRNIVSIGFITHLLKNLSGERETFEERTKWEKSLQRRVDYLLQEIN